MNLSGDVTVNDITGALFKQFVHSLNTNHVDQIDLSGVQRADSACVSLLITAMRNEKNATIALKNIPSAVVALLDLYELDDWIR